MGEPKYLLLSYERQAEFEGEQDYEETWALCEDATDLFADPPPPARDTYELLGCAPEGELLPAALTRARPRARRRSAPSPWRSSTSPARRSASGTSKTYGSSATAPVPVI